MLKMTCAKISEAFLKNGYINENDKNVFTYSVEIFLATAINFLILLAIGIVLRIIPELILFSVGFIPFRHMNGGYHASSHLKCTLILIFAIMLMYGIISLNLTAYVYFLLFTLGGLLFFNNTLDNNGNILTKSRRIELIKKSRIAVLISLTLSLLIFIFTQFSVLAYAHLFGMATASLSVLTYKITNRIKN